MSVEAIMNELEGLGPPERRKVMAFLVGLEIRDDEAYRERLTRKIDDDDAKRWLTLEELDERLERHRDK